MKSKSGVWRVPPLLIPAFACAFTLAVWTPAARADSILPKASTDVYLYSGSAARFPGRAVTEIFETAAYQL